MPAAADNRPQRAALGVALIVAAVLLMSLADGLVKGASASLTLWQIYSLRGLFAVALLLGLQRRRGGLTELWPKTPGWVALRSLLLVAMWIAYYAALPFLALSTAAVALYTAPLFIALLSAPLTGEPVGRRRWLAIALGFIGVLVILRPGDDAFSWASLLPILGAFLYAMAMLITRAKCIDEEPHVLAFALNASMLAVGLAGSLIVAALGTALADPPGQPFLLGGWGPMSGADWLLMAALGLMIVVYSMAVARAYQVAPTALVATFDYAYLIFAGIWGYLLFAEVPDRATLLGMALIAAAGWLAVSAAKRGQPAARFFSAKRQR